MNGTFDPITLLFLVIAVIIFLRLRSVLGRRTGNEKPPYDPYSPQNANGGSGDKVVRLPGAGAEGPAYEPVSAGEIEERLRDFAPKGGKLAEKLGAILRADHNFDPRSFLEGAKTAYEMVVTAFAAGNKRVLKPLLSREVYDSFAAAIDGRDQAGKSVDLKFVGINKAEITDADLTNGIAQLTIKFVSEFISATRDKAGVVVEGDPKQIQEVTDFWTFSRPVNSRDPNWTLIATESAG